MGKSDGYWWLNTPLRIFDRWNASFFWRTTGNSQVHVWLVHQELDSTTGTSRSQAGELRELRELRNTSESFFGIRSLEFVGLNAVSCCFMLFRCLEESLSSWIALWGGCASGLGCTKDGAMRQVSRNKGDTKNRDFNGENKVLLLNHGIAFFPSFSDKDRWLAIWFPFYHYAITLW